MTEDVSSAAEIVVVDDDVQMLALLAEVLSGAGYSVRGASTYEEGRRVLESHTPDLLITDVRLGAHNGLELVLRARAHTPKMPAIILTGFADSVIRAEAERFGAIYFEKPLDPDRLVAMVAEMLFERP